MAKQSSQGPASKVEKLLGMILLGQTATLPLGDRAVMLKRVGFANSEIAEMLGTTPASVAQSIYASSASKKRKKTAPSRRR